MIYAARSQSELGIGQHVSQSASDYSVEWDYLSLANPPRSSSYTVYKVKFAHAADKPGELSLEKGELVWLMKRDENGFSFVRAFNAEGLEGWVRDANLEKVEGMVWSSSIYRGIVPAKNIHRRDFAINGAVVRFVPLCYSSRN
jgi:hypothetical protein